MDNSPVIAGTDGSGASMQAVEWAAREATARRRDLYIFAVPAMPRLWQPGRPDAVAEHICAAADQALATAAARAAALEPDLCVCTERLSGPPAEGLVKAAAGASMLVVGSRGAGGFATLVLGSASRHVPSPPRAQWSWSGGRQRRCTGRSLSACATPTGPPRWDSRSRKHICTTPGCR
jgi:nucleotide-binding universal stress UspA family protein